MSKINNMKSRNYAIEALRFLFMMQICLWHYGFPNILSAGFLGVEFYFILSGFFLYRKVASVNAPSTLNFTFGRLSKFYLKYVIAVILAWIIFGHNVDLKSFEGLFRATMNFISEILMVQSTGVFGGALNAPLWYFSVLIYGGGLLYSVISYNKRLSIKVILPLLVLLFLSYCFNYGAEENLESWGVRQFIPMTMLRGICEMSIGVLIAYVYQTYDIKIKNHTLLLNFASVIAIISYLCILIWFRPLPNYVFIFFPVIIIASWVNGTWLSKIFRANIWGKLGALSYDIFILHAIVMALCNNILLRGFHLNHYLIVTIYFITLLFGSFLYDKICTRLNYKFLIAR